MRNTASLPSSPASAQRPLQPAPPGPRFRGLGHGFAVAPINLSELRGIFDFDFLKSQFATLQLISQTNVSGLCRKLFTLRLELLKLGAPPFVGRSRRASHFTMLTERGLRGLIQRTGFRDEIRILQGTGLLDRLSALRAGGIRGLFGRFSLSSCETNRRRSRGTPARRFADIRKIGLRRRAGTLNTASIGLRPAFFRSFTCH